VLLTIFWIELLFPVFNVIVWYKLWCREVIFYHPSCLFLLFSVHLVYCTTCHFNAEFKLRASENWEDDILWVVSEQVRIEKMLLFEIILYIFLPLGIIFWESITTTSVLVIFPSPHAVTLTLSVLTKYGSGKLYFSGQASNHVKQAHYHCSQPQESSGTEETPDADFCHNRNWSWVQCPFVKNNELVICFQWVRDSMLISSAAQIWSYVHISVFHSSSLTLGWRLCLAFNN